MTHRSNERQSGQGNVVGWLSERFERRLERGRGICGWLGYGVSGTSVDDKVDKEWQHGIRVKSTLNWQIDKIAGQE
jgi:hypothetical protein